MHKLKYAQENETYKILWNFEMQTDLNPGQKNKKNKKKQTHLVIIDKEKRELAV